MGVVYEKQGPGRGEKRDSWEVARVRGQLEEKEMAGIEMCLAGDPVEKMLKDFVSTVASRRR